MKKFLAATVLMVTMSALSLSAQTTQQSPQPPSAADRAQHHVQFLTTLLSLSAAQQQQATTIFSNAASEDTAHQNMRTAHENLEAAVKSNNVASIDQIAAQIGALTTQSIATEAKAKAAFYQILTPDQQSKLSQLGMHGHEMFHGPGMMGHGPR